MAAHWYYLSQLKTTEYFYSASDQLNSTLNTVKTYSYNNPLHCNLSVETSESSNGETLETKYFYPQDLEMNGEPYFQDLIDKNITSIPLDKQNFRNGVKLSEQKTTYNMWNGSLLLPEIISTSKGNASLETRVRFNEYDAFGHPLEVQMENGTVISYIWGYNHSQPIAKIENADNAAILSALGVSDFSTIDEGDMTNINNLRTGLPNAMVTTFTYIPLVGVSTITDPKGDTQTYTYDSFGRLHSVTDSQGNILSENEYHYRP
jgi:YD repeat-containing protein